MLKLHLFGVLAANILLLVSATTSTDKSKCKANERFVECPDFLCDPKSCCDLGFPQPCPERGPKDCCPGKPACVCKEGYVRDDEGCCIPEKKCPSCGGDPNAQAGCGINCGRHCSNYDKGPAACPAICVLNGCDCKEKYVFDDNIGKCVLPKDCTPVCGSNEKYSDCTNGGCFGARKCSEKGNPERCVKLKPEDCIKGCICEEGYLKCDNGTCVPEDQCPCAPKCKNPNEFYDPCPPICPPQRCDFDPSVAGVCKPNPDIGDRECEAGCRCIDDYLRNDKGICVAPDHCTPTCGENEELSICPPACDDEDCKPECVCKANYRRDDCDNCVPEDQCD